MLGKPLGAAIAAVLLLPVGGAVAASPKNQADLTLAAPDDALPADFRGEVTYQGPYRGQVVVPGQMRGRTYTFPRTVRMGGGYSITLRFAGAQVTGEEQYSNEISGDSATPNPGRVVGRREGATCYLTAGDGTTSVNYCGRREFRTLVDQTNTDGQRFSLQSTARTAALVDYAERDRQAAVELQRQADARAAQLASQPKPSPLQRGRDNGAPMRDAGAVDKDAPDGIRRLLVAAVMRDQQTWKYNKKVVPGSFSPPIFIRKQGVGEFYRMNYQFTSDITYRIEEGIDGFIYHGAVKCLIYYRNPADPGCYVPGGEWGSTARPFNVARFSAEAEAKENERSRMTIAQRNMALANEYLEMSLVGDSETVITWKGGIGPPPSPVIIAHNGYVGIKRILYPDPGTTMIFHLRFGVTSDTGVCTASPLKDRQTNKLSDGRIAVKIDGQYENGDSLGALFNCLYAVEKIDIIKGG